jgi:hypothetical protein
MNMVGANNSHDTLGFPYVSESETVIINRMARTDISKCVYNSAFLMDDTSLLKVPRPSLD